VIRHRTIAWAAIMLLWAASAPPARALEVWTPQAGEADLESLPQDTVEARRDYAYALMGAGQWAAGIRAMRAAIAEAPDAGWVPEARLGIARSRMTSGQLADAFAELGAIAADYAGSEIAGRARELQFQVARREGGESLGRSFDHLDQLLADSRSRAESARVLKAKGDVAFDARRYVMAQDEYLTVIDFYPDSEWVPYCELRIGECQWRLAQWLRLGDERAQGAERAFADFAARYPQHTLAPAARRRVQEVRSFRAERLEAVARFYARNERRPWAARAPLHTLAEEFADTPQGAWAAGELARMRGRQTVVPRGTMRRLALPGVAARPAQQ